MTKRDIVLSVINGELEGYVPSCFSLHFPPEDSYGDKGVAAHIKFHEETDMDILKIMNENLVPYCGPFIDGRSYKQIPAFSMKDDFMKAQIAFSEEILRQCKDNPFTIGTLHGVVASAVHPLRKDGFSPEEARTFQTEALRSDRQVLVDAYHRIADGMSELAQAYIKAGVDGVYFAALGGEYRYFTDEEFAECIEPFDKQILMAIREAGGKVFLHICKDHLNMERYASYVDYCDVVNWGVYEAPFSLDAGKKMFPYKTIMGGLANRSGVLIDGTDDDIRKEVRRIIEWSGRKQFILGADCTLPTDQDLHKLKVCIDEARKQ